MFEVLFILTTLDAGTRVGRFMLQDLGRHFWPAFGNFSSYPMTMLSSLLFVAAWGFFLYQGVKDPLGGVNILWPLFGISNQLLAGIALTVATGIIVKMGKVRYAWVTGLPLTWLAIMCSWAAWEKVFSPNPAIGFLAGANDLAAKIAAGAMGPETLVLFTGQRIDAFLAALFVIILWTVIVEMLRMSLRYTAGQPVPPLAESGYIRTRLAGQTLSTALH
jgi:carbon starvation protein